MKSYRVTVSAGPYSHAHLSDAPPWADGGWVCRWIAPPGGAATPEVYVYRRVFDVVAAKTVRVHVTADERYALFLDGQPLGVGPERGDPDQWFFETYDLPLAAGRHVLTARVWSLGALAPWAQRTVRHGLLVAPQDAADIPLLGTGAADWEYARQEGMTFHNPSADLGTAAGVGAAETIDAAAYPWGIERGLESIAGAAWQPVVAGERGNDGFTLYPFRPAHRLSPAPLPPMMDERIAGVSIARSSGPAVDWAGFADGASVALPPHSKATAVIELPTYACFYPRLRIDGGTGATVRWTIAEAPSPKGDRRSLGDEGEGEGEGKMIRGLTDTLLADGGAARWLAPLWWRCGRWVQITVETAAEAVSIGDFELRETRYPFAELPPAELDDPQLVRLLALCRRTVETCCHETYMDCPYYEQLMYVGDARLQCLCTYVISPDARPAIKALAMIESSRSNFNRLPTDAAPGDSKFIPTFSLQWIGMVYEFSLYHDRPDVAAAMLPGVRAILERFDQYVDGGVLRSPPGWNFIDWAKSPFKFGVPPGGKAGGASASINLSLLLALDQAHALENYAGEPELAALHARRAGELASAIERHFYNPAAGLFRETPGSDVATEHAQALAVVSGRYEQKVGDFSLDQSLVRAAPYFTHFVIEALRRQSDAAGIFARLEPWLGLPAQGLFTTPETFGATRSDCHAWTSHPLYHAVATLAGVRPAAPGGRDLTIHPLLGPLRRLSTAMSTSAGAVRVDYTARDESIELRLDLPIGLIAELQTSDGPRRLEGRQAAYQITLPHPVPRH